MICTSCPKLNMDECIHSLGNATIFSTLDSNRGYWQVEIADEGRNKAPLTSHHGRFQFIWMLFWLRQYPKTFQRVMDVLGTKVKGHFSVGYLDGIVIFSRTPDQHINNIRQVLTLLYDGSVTISVKKYEFFSNCVDYLCYVMWPGRFEKSIRLIEGTPGI